MNLYEVSDLINSSTANLMASQTIFLSMITAYLVVAYTIGEKLTLYQVSVVNLIFTLSILNGTAGGVAGLEMLMDHIAASMEIQGIDETGNVIRATVTSFVYVAIRLIFLVASLGFMWQVRHPKTE